jgi:hypothetical protein
MKTNNLNLKLFMRLLEEERIKIDTEINNVREMSGVAVKRRGRPPKSQSKSRSAVKVVRPRKNRKAQALAQSKRMKAYWAKRRAEKAAQTSKKKSKKIAVKKTTTLRKSNKPKLVPTKAA